MNVSQITEKTHRYTRTNDGTYADSNILIDLNLIKNEINLDILRWQGYKELLNGTAVLDLADWTNVLAGELGYNGEVPFPVDLLDIIRLEVKYHDKMQPVTIYKNSENVFSEHEDISDHFSISNPQVIFSRGAMRLRPIPSESVTDGLIIDYQQRQADLTTGSPILEKSLHRIFPLKLAYEYGLEHPDKMNPKWKPEIRDLEEKIRRYYVRKLHQPQQITILKTSYK